MSLTDLPKDILLLILPLIDPKDFLSLCSVNRAFYSSLLSEPTYWRVQTSATFRIPINPLLFAEGGSKWYWLYKKLRTQTTAYSWGHDSGLGALCHRGRGEIVSAFGSRHINPAEMALPPEIGVIADLQCGGWSTTILTSKGDLWSVGILDSANGRRWGKPESRFTKLQYGYTPDEGYPSTEGTESIKQFSSGRRHLLGLDDSGGIWVWSQIHEPARPVEFLSPALIGGKKPSRVVAGWSTSTAFIPDQGIVYWQPPERERNPSLAINEKVVPHTGYHKSDSHRSQFAGESVPDTDPGIAEFVGQVLVHVVLESYIVFITSTSKVFAFRIDDTEGPFEITSLSSKSTGYGPLVNIQGSFRHFAVFHSTGQVPTCTQAYIEDWHRGLDAFLQEHVSDANPLHRLQSHNILPPPPLVPALQSTQVISLAFGDYHFLALHSTGDISSYGLESNSCGTFGLGVRNSTVRQLRGMVSSPRRPIHASLGVEIRPTAQAWRSPRRIWFDRERQSWILALAEKVAEKGWNREPRPETNVEANDRQFQPETFGLSSREWAALSEWVEQEGQAWYAHTPGVPSTSPPSNHHVSSAPSSAAALTSPFPEHPPAQPFFALNVSAAGHHSAAVVLRDHHANTIYPDPPNSTPISRSDLRREARDRLGRAVTRVPRIVVPGIQPRTIVGEGLGTQRDGSGEAEVGELDEWPLGIPDRVFTDEDAAADGNEGFW